ncbi:MAG: hypothetical protein PWP65_1378 [Clostridia bacterium]|nr:hypothetical protein [Clostridia bacterium]
METGATFKCIVLDAWAILAWLQGEPAGEIVKNILEWAEGNGEAGIKIKTLLPGLNAPPRILLNLINLGEVFYILGRKKGEKEARKVINNLRSGPVELVEASESIIFAAATLKMKYAISYADAFAAATAKMKKGALLTGDPELKRFREVSVIWLE